MCCPRTALPTPAARPRQGARWSPRGEPTARMICDVQTTDGDPYVGDPRHILRRALERANEMGFDRFNVGPELEFFYFKDSSGTEPLDYGGHLDLTTLDGAAGPRAGAGVLLLQGLERPRAPRLRRLL